MSKQRGIAHYHTCQHCGRRLDCHDPACGAEDFNQRLDDKGHVCRFCSEFSEVDLREITREPDRFETVVYLYDGLLQKRWLVLGQARLQPRGGSSSLPSLWTFDAFLADGATDFEHDSAYAVSLSLVAVEFKHVFYSCSEFVAAIAPHDHRGFHVPPPGYNPMELPGAYECDHSRCQDEPHIVVPEGYYLPPTDRELFRKVAGRFVRITFGVPVKKEKR